MKYLEVQLTNLQGGSFHSTATTASASFTDPVVGDHPVFVGIGQQNGDFLTVGLERARGKDRLLPGPAAERRRG